MAARLAWHPGSRPAFVPRPRGFGAALLGLEPRAAREDPASAIRAVRKERELLRPDLTLATADPALLAGALDRRLELDQSSPAWSAAVQCASALSQDGPTALLLSGPLSLAWQMAIGDEPDEDLIDECALAVRDAAEAVLAVGAEVVLAEQRAPDAAAFELYAPLLNLLRHRRQPAIAVVLDGEAGRLGEVDDAIALVATGPAVHEWSVPGGELFSPEIPPDADPELVQALVRESLLVVSENA